MNNQFNLASIVMSARSNLVFYVLFIATVMGIGLNSGVAHAADNLPPQFVEETVVTGLIDPVNIITMPDGRMIVLEKVGRVNLIDPTTPLAPPTVILGIGAIQVFGERGLASIALDPDFENNGYFYLYYTQLGNDNRNRISRFFFDQATSTVAGPELLVWEDNEPVEDCCHFGGGMDFGPDDHLYLATGEEFDGPQAQDLTRAGGKIIRLVTTNLDASGPWVRGGTNAHIIPADNPPEIMDGAGPNLDEIWAYGLRNPFRAYWDIPTNRFFMGEVGGNIQATATEDLHIGRAGANYGWPICEGDCVNPDYDDPIYFYTHTGATPIGGAIVAGTIYRNDFFPEEYRESFFIADYAIGYIQYLKFDPTGTVVESVNEFATNAGALVALEVGPDGALYAVDYVGGRVVRYVYDSGNQRPAITSTAASVQVGPAPLSVDFTATASDFENDPLTYHWFFGDGTDAFGASVSHTYTVNGARNAFVVVTDADGSATSDTIPIQIGAPPVAQIDYPADGATFRAGQDVPFGGSFTDPDSTTGATYSWDIDFFHNAHVHPGILATTATGIIPISSSGHDYHDDTGYELVLTVTDVDGLTDTTSIRVYPEKVNMDLATVPAGLGINVDGLPISTPSVYDTVIDFNHTVSVPQSICSNGTQFDFQSWSDGGARTHLYIVPEGDSALTVTYQSAGSCSLVPAAGLAAHYESDQAVITTGDLQTNGGDPVVSWNDISGNGNHLDLVNGDPVLQPGALNGNPAIDFDGFGDALQRLENIEGFPHGNSDRTVYIVATYESVGSGGFGYGAQQPNSAFGLHISDSGLLRVNGFVPAFDFISNTVGTNAGWLIQSAVVQDNMLTHYKDGVVIDTAENEYSTNFGPIVLGADLDTDPFVDMQVAAILVYDRALSVPEQLQVSDYLQNKYFTVNGNRVPIAVADEVGVANGGAVDIAILDNDIDDVLIDPTTVVVTQMPAAGMITVDPLTGVVSYSHNGVASMDSFRYSVMDDQGLLSNEALVTISLNSPGSLLNDGLVARFESDFGILGTGDLVTGWTDQSGTGNDMTTIGDPRLVQNVLGDGDIPAVVFDGETDRLERIANITGLPAGSNPRSMYLLVKYESPGFGGFAYGEALSNQTFGLVADATPSGKLTVQGWGQGNDFTTIQDGVDEGWQVQSAVFDGNILRHYENGTLIDIRNHEYNTVVNRMVLAAEIDGSPSVAMQVGAVLIYDRELTTIEQQQVQNYLQLKYELVKSNNAPPLAKDDRITVAEGTSGVIDVLTNDDAPGIRDVDPTTVAIVAQPTGGSVSVDRGNGEITYTHNGVSTGDSFTYTFVDTIGQTSNAATVVVNIGTPVVIPTFGLISRYESDLEVSTIGSAVARWDDQVTRFSNDLTGLGQQFGAPALVDDVLNGLPVIRFDGQDDALARFGEMAGYPERDRDRSIYMVASYKSAGGGFGYGLENVNRIFGLSNAPNGNLRVNAFGATFDKISDTPGTNQGWIVQGAVVEDLLMTQYVNNEVIDTAVRSYNTSFNGKLVLGADLDFAPFVQMDVAAVFIYDRALDEFERSQLQAYFQDKYDIENAGIPLANDDSYEIFEGESAQLDVLANDFDDISLDNTTITIVDQPISGTIDINTVTGVISYTNIVANAMDTFTYTVADNIGTVSEPATVTIAIDNDRSPIAINDTAGVENSGTIVVSVLDNDTDDGTIDFSSLVIVQIPAGGTATVIGDTGTISYTHDGQVSSDLFTYAVLDDSGQLSNIGTVNITLTTPGELPADGLVVMLEADVGVITTGNTVTAWQDQSGQGNDLQGIGTPTIIQSGLNGQPIINFDGDVDRLERLGNLTGLPLGNADRTVFMLTRYNSNGFGGFTYGDPIENNAFGLIVSNSGRLSIQGWGAGNDFITPLVGRDAGWLLQAASLSSDTLIHYYDGGVIATENHQFDTTGGRMVVGAEIDGAPQLDMQVGAILVYDRTLTDLERELVENYFLIKYNLGASNNQPPIAANDRIRIAVGTSQSIDVLANDTDDGPFDASSVEIVVPPAGGTASVDPVTGEIVYQHGGFVDVDQIVYIVRDSYGVESNQAVLEITIGDPIVLPTAGLAAHFEADEFLTLAGANRVVSWGDQSGFANTLTGTGGVTVIPNALNGNPVLDFDGVDGLIRRDDVLHEFPVVSQNRSVFMVASYEGVGSGGFGYGQLAGNRVFGLHVNQGGLLRVNGYGANNDFVSSTEGTGAGWIIQSAVLDSNNVVHSVNGEPIDSFTHEYNTVFGGQLVLGADMDVSPHVDMQVAALLVYQRALSVEEQAQVIGYLNEKYDVTNVGKPQAVNDLAIVAINGSVDINVLENDTDDGVLDSASIAIVIQPTGGSVEIDTLTGVVAYTHSGVVTSDSFTYTVADDQGRVSTAASVLIEVDDDLIPIANDDELVLANGATATVDVLANDTDDIQIDPTTVSVIEAPANGTFVVDPATGAIEYTHNGFSSTDQFTYTYVDSGSQVSNEATVRISINTPGDLPASGLVLHLESDQGVTIDGGRITQWVDQSASGNDLASAGNPQLVPNILNGLPVVDLDGSEDLLQRIGGLADIPVGASDRTIFLLTKYRGFGYGGLAYGDANLNEAFGLIVDPIGRLALQGWGPRNDYISATLGTGEGWILQEVIVDSNEFTHLSNNEIIDIQDHTFNTAADRLVLGAELDGAPQIDMQVAAVLIYDQALAPLERQQVRNYLEIKYRLSTSNDAAPVTVADYVTLPGGTSTLIDVLANDTDDGVVDATSVTIVGAPQNGTAVVNVTTGEVTYNHGGAVLGDFFTYTVADDLGQVSNETTVTIANLPSGLVAHYESDVLVVSDANGVTSWGDQSGEGNDLTGVGNVQLVDDGLNGQPVMDFDGVGDALVRTDALANFPVANEDRSVFFVASYEGLGSGGLAYGLQQPNRSFGLHVESAGLLRINGYGGFNDYVSGTTGSGAGWLVQSAVLTGGVMDHSVNGSTIDSYTHTYITGAGDLVLGADLDLSPFVDMQVAAVLVYDRALNAAEQQEVQTYLADKYNVQGVGSPQVVDDETVVATGLSIEIDVLANDIPVDGAIDAGSVLIGLQPIHGTVAVDAVTGVITYTHNNVSGTADTFTYSVTNDDGRRSSEASVAVEIDDDLSPVAVDDAYDVVIGATIDLAVLANDSDDNALDPSTVTVISVPVGSYSVNATTGVISYTHDGIVVTDNFTYTVEDGTGQISEETTVAITTLVENSLPLSNLVLQLESDVGIELDGTTVTGWLDQSGSGLDLVGAGDPQLQSNVLNGLSVIDFDGEGDRLERLSAVTALPAGAADRTVVMLVKYDSVGYGGFAYGNASVNNAFGTIVDRFGNFAVQGWGGGNDSVTSQVGTGEGWLVQSAILDANQLTQFFNNQAMDENNHVFNTTLGRIMLGAEIDGDPELTMQVATVLVYDRALSLLEHQQVLNYLETKYRLSTSNDTGPIGVADSVTLPGGSSAIVAVLANDTDDGALNVGSVSIVRAPENGTATVNPATGTITYSHGGAVLGDLFSYTVEDDVGQLSNETTVTIANLPSGLVGHYETDFLVGVGANGVTTWGDQTGEGNDLIGLGDVQLISEGLNGQPVLDFDGAGDALVRTDALSSFPLGNSNRSIYLVANYEGLGSGGFAYGQQSLNRSFGLHVEGTGLLRINGYGNANDFVSGTTGTGAGWMVQSAVLTGGALNHAINGITIDTATHTYNTGAGDLVLGADLDENPYVNMQVAAVLVYDRALSPAEQQEVQTYLRDKYNVQGVGSPLVTDDTGIVATGLSIEIDVLANDVPVEGVIDAGSVFFGLQPLYGTVAVDAVTGAITYSHIGGAGVLDTFTYSVANDAGRRSSDGLVTVEIDDDLSPVAVNDAFEVAIGATVDLDVLANDTDDNALDPTTLTIVSAPTGSYSVDGATGVISYTHDGVVVTDSLVYMVADDTGQVSEEATVTITPLVSDALPATNLVLQLESDFGIELSGTTVTGWMDRSGSGLDLVGAGDPQLQSNVLNGLPVIDFDGTDDRLQRLSAVTALPVSATDRSVFMLAKYDGGSFGGFAYGNTSPNNAYGLIVDQFGRLVVQGWGGANDFASSEIGTGSGWLVQSAVVDTNALTHYRDGVQIDSDTHAFDTTLDRIMLGSGLSGTSTGMQMQIASVLVYDRALSLLEQQQVMNYLETKYSLTTSNDSSPTTVADTATLPSGGSVVVDVLANDSDDGELDLTSVTVARTPQNGTAIVNAVTGAITYNHGGAVLGDLFTYTVADNNGQVSNEATVTIGNLPNGMVAHFEADSLVGLDANGVSSWGDQSGQGNDLTGVGDVQLVNDSLNGQPILDFDGVGDALVRTDVLANFPVGNGDRSVYTVVSYEGFGSGGLAYGLQQANRAFGLHVEGTGLLRINGFVGANDYVTTTTGTGAGWLVQSAVLTSNTMNHSVNGSTIDTYTHTYNTGAGDLVLGADLDESPYVDMQVAAVLIYNRALNAAEQLEVQTYLSNKYNVQGVGSPQVTDDTGIVATGLSVDIEVLANDTPVEGVIDASSVLIGLQPIHGTVAVDAVTGVVVYTHNNATGVLDTFTYTVANDADRRSTEAVVTVEIDDDLSPVAVDDVFEVLVGATIDIDVLANDTDDNNLDPSSLLILSAPIGNYSVDSVTGVISYTHDGVVVSDSLVYTVSDDTGQVSEETTVTITALVGDSLPATNLVLQLDSDLGIQTSGSTVTGWIDQSGSGLNLVGAGDPQLLPNVLNGLPVIDFDGTDDRLQRLSAVTALPAGATDRTVFMLAKYDGGSFGGFAYGNTNNNNAFGLIVDQFGRMVVQGWGVGNDFPATNIGTGAGWLVQSAVVNANAITHYRDGVEIDADTHAFDSTLDRIMLGSGLAGTDTGMEMQVASVLVYDRALSQLERQQVMNYLDTKFNLTTSNDAAPMTVADSATLLTGGSVVIDVLANDTDNGGLDLGSVMIVSLPANGTASVNASTGAITYNHFGAVLGDLFTYSVADNLGQVSVETTVRIGNLPAGLVAHFEADNLVGSDASGVTSWGDQSGQGNDLTGIGDVQLISDGLNGQPVLDFDGAGDALVRTDALSNFPLGDSDRSVYTVVSYEGVGSGGFGYGVRQANRIFGLHVEGSGLLRINGFIPENDFVSTTTGTGAGWLVQSAILSNDVMDHAVNGATIDSYTHAYNTGAGDLVLGADLDQNPYVDMQVAAVLVYDRALNAAEQQEVQTYLQTKYNVQGAGAPLVQADAGIVFTGASIVIDVLDNDVAINGAIDVGSVLIGAQPTHGEVSVEAFSGDITYTHNGVSGVTDTFTYTVANGDNRRSLEALVTIEIDDDLSPVTNNDAFGIVVGATIELDVLSNDTDDNGLDLSTVAIVSMPFGSYTIDSVTGVINYTHDGSSVSDSFTYTVEDGIGQVSEEATVTITASLTDDLPLTNLVLQLESDLGIAATSTTVIAWADQSGSGLDLVGVGDPQLLPNILNGLPVIDFDGTDDRLQRLANITALPAGATDRTVVMLAKYDGGSFGGFAYGDTNTNNAFGLMIDQFGQLVVQGWGAANDFPSQDIGRGTGWIVQSATVDANTLTHTLNGQQIDSDTHAFNTTLDRIMLGSNLSGTETGLEMQVATVLVYDRALSALELQQVQNYLETKYNLVNSNDASPVAVDDQIQIINGTTQIIAVLGNDIEDSAFNTATVAIVQQPTAGSVSINTNTGAITYVHSGTATEDSFTYTVSDDVGQLSNVATVSIGVTTLPAGIVGHYTADSLVAQNANGVVGWGDQSGQGNDLTGVGDVQLLNTGFNGRPVLDFDGVGDALIRTGPLQGYPLGDDDRTIFMLVSYEGVGSGGFAYGQQELNRAFGLSVEGTGLLRVNGYGGSNDYVSATTGTGGRLVDPKRQNGS